MGSMRRKSTGSQYESFLKSTQAQGFFKNFKKLITTEISGSQSI